MSTNTSTLEDLTGVETARRGRLTRRAGLALMVLIPLSSFLGIYGPTDRTVGASAEPYELTMSHGYVVRSGQAITLDVEITSVDGFDGPVELAFAREVFERLDFQNWYPNPAGEVGEGRFVLYEFDPPEGTTFTLSLDARVAPTQWGSWDTHAIWMVRDGQDLLRTEYTMWVLP